MERAKKVRGASRGAFTRALNALETELGKEEPSTQEINVVLQLLEEKNMELQAAEVEVFNLLIDSNETEVDIEANNKMADEYRVKFFRIKSRVESMGRTSHSNASVTENTDEERQRSFRLPKIELKKFNGDVKEWLSFWSLFKKIHEDSNIGKEDKFQYLVQAMIPNTRAYDLVQSFPPTSDNYDKAIASLKSRFGRDDLLVEVYVRELLKLVLQNALKPDMKPQLSTLYDRIECQLRALETLGVATDKCAAMLFPLVESSMPEELLRAWQRSPKSSAEPQYRLARLMEFMQSEVENEQRIAMAVDGFDIKDGRVRKTRNVRDYPEAGKHVPTATGLFSAQRNAEARCIFCKENHENVNCAKARNMDFDEKKRVVQQNNCCFNCLKWGHMFKRFRVRIKCTRCGKHHATIMCRETKREEIKLPQKMEPEEKTEVTVEHTLTNNTRNPEVLLQTLKVMLRGEGKSRVVRALIDGGSQRSYINKTAAMDMGYPVVGEQLISHSLFGGVSSGVQKHRRYMVRLTSLDGKYACKFEVLDQETICDGISTSALGPWEQELVELDVQLTDVHSDSEPIEILLGADVCGKLMTGRRYVLQCGLVAMETYLGWTLMGKIPADSARDDAVLTVMSMFSHEASVTDLWALDILGIRDPVVEKTMKEREREIHLRFLETVRINGDGRYEVSLPWIESHPSLSNNEDVARKRLQVSTRRLKAEGIFEEYDQVLRDWCNEGIIEEVPDVEMQQWSYYLPHRHVVKEGSTTRIRPVFDASGRVKGFPSLNQCLEKGPNLIELISSVLLRFRDNVIGVVADIRKAFLQISVRESDRNYLRFLWYDKEGKISVFRHTRVVFGVTCSPYLLGAVINFHLDGLLQSNHNHSREIILKLKESFYVDNCVTSVGSDAELRQFIESATAVMATGAFDLRGWEHSSDSGEEARTPVLGIMWDKQEDTLALNVPHVEKPFDGKITKRYILSVAHRFFDPIGFACPVLLFAKILLQETWKIKIGWDDQVSEDISHRFLKWFHDLPSSKMIRIPRYMFTSISDEGELTLHVFCDASKVAYAAVIFARFESSAGVTMRLVQTKSRVAPTNEVTIPRLELLAATVAARVAKSVVEVLGRRAIRMYFWSDSSTVLAWIRRSGEWGTFVRNRVQEIRKLTDPEDWRHVPGELNPADLPSRGCTVEQLIGSAWWEGPKWLRDNPREWPSSTENYNEYEICREKKKTEVSTSLLTIKDSKPVGRTPWYARYFSSYQKIIRLVGWMRRFIANCQRPSTSRVKGELTVEEYKESNRMVMILIQKECFESESDSAIKSLNAFKTEDGLIRIKTKLIQRSDDYNFRYPVVLPAGHVAVTLLIRETHERLGHAGLQILLSHLREDYWILGGRKTVQSIIRKCVVCARQNAKALESDPVPLPENRVKEAAAFEVIGVDFAGPVFLRGEQKGWFCLLTCAVYRAIHLELTTSLSTVAFLEVFRRFVARRGRPKVVYSDNGRNFVGTQNLLKDIDWRRVEKSGASQQIEWKFNPPRAPWRGGWWERLIGLVKRLLRRMLGRACLSYEEMSTVLCDCEAIINARPITYLSDTTTDFVPLTPAMFIQDIKEIGVPDFDIVERGKLHKRFRYRQKIKDALRRRFRSEYLGALSHRVNRQRKIRKIRVGDVVLIGDDHSKRLDWPLARVKEKIMGKGGSCRVLRLVTASGELVRPLQRVYPLELSDEAVDRVPVEMDNERMREEPNNAQNIVTRSGRVIRKPCRLSYE